MRTISESRVVTDHKVGYFCAVCLPPKMCILLTSSTVFSSNKTLQRNSVVSSCEHYLYRLHVRCMHFLTNFTIYLSRASNKTRCRQRKTAVALNAQCDWGVWRSDFDDVKKTVCTWSSEPKPKLSKRSGDKPYYRPMPPTKRPKIVGQDICKVTLSDVY